MKCKFSLLLLERDHDWSSWAKEYYYISHADLVHGDGPPGRTPLSSIIKIKDRTGGGWAQRETRTCLCCGEIQKSYPP